jgi:hypothetical protein
VASSWNWWSWCADTAWISRRTVSAGRRIPGRGFAHQELGEPGLAEELDSAVPRLGDAVGVQHQPVTRRPPGNGLRTPPPRMIRGGACPALT